MYIYITHSEAKHIGISGKLHAVVTCCVQDEFQFATQYLGGYKPCLQGEKLYLAFNPYNLCQSISLHVFPTRLRMNNLFYITHAAPYHLIYLLFLVLEACWYSGAQFLQKKKLEQHQNSSKHNTEGPQILGTKVKNVLAVGATGILNPYVSSRCDE